ncbi:MAG TPA: phosphate-starvation-inducible PsiE family protein [Pseudolabrys sp.]|jgi:uncharacterized membrane protein (DUF373 family)|nr:phosphate-starvation-inducible PsiE family protein [Pseudolabrys sp.]
MFNIAALKREWKDLTSHERFEQVVSRIIMLFIAVLIVYSLIAVGIELVRDVAHSSDFVGGELLQDVFGSLLTVLILLEFNHSIATSLGNRSGILQTRVVVLIAILVVARKVILLDFKTATLESLAGVAGMALSLGVLYWLLSLNGSPRPSASSVHAKPPPDEA